MSSEYQNGYEATRQLFSKSDIEGHRASRWYSRQAAMGETRMECSKGCGHKVKILWTQEDMRRGTRARYEHKLARTIERHEDSCFRVGQLEKEIAL